MHWIHDYQLFLFDFDGILVNTEELHFLAYKKMCQDRGFPLTWDMSTYMQHAMYFADGLQKAVYHEFPGLEQQEPCWEVLYQEKKREYADLLISRGVSLMPGIKELLEVLEKNGITRCVVTHSAAHQTALIRTQNPLLDTIPHWITREDYQNPKPSPECYQMAIKRYAQKGDCVIGFEDSPRGLKALLGSGAKGVLVTEFFGEKEVSRLKTELSKDFFHARSIVDIH